MACEWQILRFMKKKRNGERDLDEMAMQNRQDWYPLSVEATPTEVPAKQIYFTPV